VDNLLLTADAHLKATLTSFPEHAINMKYTRTFLAVDMNPICKGIHTHIPHCLYPPWIMRALVQGLCVMLQKGEIFLPFAITDGVRWRKAAVFRLEGIEKEYGLVVSLSMKVSDIASLGIVLAGLHTWFNLSYSEFISQDFSLWNRGEEQWDVLIDSML